MQVDRFLEMTHVLGEIFHHQEELLTKVHECRRIDVVLQSLLVLFDRSRLWKKRSPRLPSGGRTPHVQQESRREEWQVQRVAIH